MTDQENKKSTNLNEEKLEDIQSYFRITIYSNDEGKKADDQVIPTSTEAIKNEATKLVEGLEKAISDPDNIKVDVDSVKLDDLLSNNFQLKDDDSNLFDNSLSLSTDFSILSNEKKKQMFSRGKMKK